MLLLRLKIFKTAYLCSFLSPNIKNIFLILGDKIESILFYTVNIFYPRHYEYRLRGMLLLEDILLHIYSFPRNFFIKIKNFLDYFVKIYFFYLSIFTNIKNIFFIFLYFFKIGWGHMGPLNLIFLLEKKKYELFYPISLFL